MGRINLKNKKILVTGGNGYLGRKLIEKLITYGAIVFSIDLYHNAFPSNVVCYNLNLLDADKLNYVVNEIQPFFVYHLAAVLDRAREFSNAKSILEVNLTGTINLINALKNVDYENLIYTSTSEVYGGNLSRAPFKENDKLIPASPYSLSKFCAEISIMTFSNIYQKNYTILRLFNFYSNDMPKNFFISQLIDKLSKNEDFDMTAGEQKRDFLHVNDVVESLILATTPKAYNQVFNVCSGNGKTLKEIALEFKKKLDSKSRINFGVLPYRKNEIWDLVGDNTKIKKLLGYKPRLNLSDFFDKIINDGKNIQK